MFLLVMIDTTSTIITNDGSDDSNDKGTTYGNDDCDDIDSINGTDDTDWY